MDTLSIQRLLLQLDLMPTEKLVGMTLAIHFNKRAKNIRVRQEIIAAECGLSLATVKRAIKALVAANVFESKRTGRAAILVPVEPRASGKNSGIVERSPTSHLVAHSRAIGKKKGMPWDYDLPLSSKPEEEGKRIDAMLAHDFQKGGKIG